MYIYLEKSVRFSCIIKIKVLPLQHQIKTVYNMAETKPTYEGKERRYKVADDAHEWIMQHGGGRYITETMRTIKATSTINNHD